jgi:3-methyladenine DNA glycosylase AlkD
MQSITKKIRADLKQNASEKVKKSGKRFFKEKIKVYGVKSAVVVKIAKESFKEIKEKDKSEIFEMCEELWQSGFLEESFVACNWCYALRKSFEPKDFKVFERWIEKYVSNWASCDTFCNHTMGEFVVMYPEFLVEFKKMSKSKNKWVRRAAAASLIVPAKKGKFLKDVFEISDILLQDKEDMVQKGYGWMLKVASQAHQKEVFEYVMKNKKNMPRTALRYAIEKMPKGLKQKAMEV